MTKRKPLDDRIPPDLQEAGWKLVTRDDFFLMKRIGVRTATANSLENAIEHARRITTGRMSGIPIAKKPRGKPPQPEDPTMIYTECRHPLCTVKIMLARYHKAPFREAPIELEPSDDGNILVTGSSYEIIPKEHRQKVLARGLKLRKNHFATCPFAKQFSKAKSQATGATAR